MWVFFPSNGPATLKVRILNFAFKKVGIYLQGSQNLGIGIWNDVAWGNIFVDSSINNHITAEEYLRDGSIVESPRLQSNRNPFSQRQKLIGFAPKQEQSCIKIVPFSYPNEQPMNNFTHWLFFCQYGVQHEIILLLLSWWMQKSTTS